MAATARGAVDAPVTPNAQPEVGALMRYLDGLSGQYVLSGQQEFPGWTDDSKDVDFDYILKTTGKRPVVRGFDFLFYVISPDGRAGQHSTERAIAWSRAGGIVTFCCHMFMDIGSPAGNPQFYVPSAAGTAGGTTFDIRQAVIDGTPENKEYLAKLDLIATELKKLRDAHVPVIWRPFHECSGGWFWWGAHGPTPLIAAWHIMFARFTQVHGLNNLIWEFNPTDSTTNLQSWYPGDNEVDAISLDFYPSAGTHPDYATDYKNLRAFKNGRKLVAMSENGAIPDPDQMFADGANWAYFNTWNGFESNTAQNSADFLNRVYNHTKVLTLDEERPLFANQAFTITTPPATQMVVAGSPLTLNVAAHDSAAVTYQWFKDGTAIAGATSATYSVAAATANDAGVYTASVTGSTGTLTSLPATVTVAPTNNGRLINLSVLARAGTGDQTLIVGFNLGGEGTTKKMLLRAAGPTLSAFGVSNFLTDPVIQLNTTPAVVNDNWEVNTTASAATITDTFDQVGAFGFPSGSKDAALIASLGAGGYTTNITGAGGASGTAIAEIYDAAPGSGLRLINESARCAVGGGASLTAGFVIDGGPRTVLVRAIGGTTLASFGVSGVLANPKLQLFDLKNNNALVAENEDWAGGAAVATVQAAGDKVSAFGLDPATRDAVLYLTLQPGQYSAQVTSTDAGSGVAIIEVYEVR